MIFNVYFSLLILIFFLFLLNDKMIVNNTDSRFGKIDKKPPKNKKPPTTNTQKLKLFTSDTSLTFIHLDLQTAGFKTIKLKFSKQTKTNNKIIQPLQKTQNKTNKNNKTNILGQIKNHPVYIDYLYV